METDIFTIKPNGLDLKQVPQIVQMILSRFIHNGESMVLQEMETEKYTDIQLSQLSKNISNNSGDDWSKVLPDEIK